MVKSLFAFCGVWKVKFIQKKDSKWHLSCKQLVLPEYTSLIPPFHKICLPKCTVTSLDNHALLILLYWPKANCLLNGRMRKSPDHWVFDSSVHFIEARGSITSVGIGHPTCARGALIGLSHSSRRSILCGSTLFNLTFAHGLKQLIQTMVVLTCSWQRQ